MSKETDLFAELSKLEKKGGESDLEYQLRLTECLATEQAKAEGPQQEANLYRIKLGLVLLDERPKEGVLKWQKAKAKELGYQGKETRAIRELIGVAEALQAAKVDKRGLARSVPIEVTKRPWSHVKRTVKVFAETGKLEGKLPVKALTPDRALKALGTALKRARDVVSEDQLQAWLTEVSGTLAQSSVPAVPQTPESQPPSSSPVKPKQKSSSKKTEPAAVADDVQTPTVAAATKPASSSKKVPANMTLKEATEAYLKDLGNRAPVSSASGARTALALLADFLGSDQKVPDIQQQDIEDFFADPLNLTTNRAAPSDSTVRVRRSQIKAALTRWHRQGWIEEISVPGSRGKERS